MGAKVASEAATVVRAFELPVRDVECADGRDGWALLRECWRQAACLSNWGVRQLLHADVVRDPSMERLPRMPRIDGPKHKGLYGLATDTLGLKAGWWAGACISASTILRGVERKYAQDRLEVVWHQRKAPCTYRDPAPWPIHASSWRVAALDSSKRPYVVAALPGGLVTLRLKNGPDFRRQMALFREVVDGARPRRQLVVYQRGTGATRRVMCKMVADIEVRDRPGQRCLVLLTDPHAFWVAELDGRRAWVLNADHVRCAVARHLRHLCRLQRLGEDAKAGRRLGNNLAADMLPAVEAACQRDRDRLASFTHEAAAHLTGFAVRQGVGEVFYLDRDRGFLPSFPWHALRGKLEQKLQLSGIDFYSESGAATVAAPVEGEGPDDGPGSDRPWEDYRCTRQIDSRVTALRNLLAGQKRRTSHPAVSAPCAI